MLLPTRSETSKRFGRSQSRRLIWVSLLGKKFRIGSDRTGTEPCGVESLVEVWGKMPKAVGKRKARSAGIYWGRIKCQLKPRRWHEDELSSSPISNRAT